MPFTPSHAVVALPFLRTPLVPAAIAVGAMTPDLPLFIRGAGVPYAISHDFRWVPLTVAAALVLLLLWRCALRPAVRDLAPRRVAGRLPDEWDLPWRAALRDTLRPSGLIALALSLAIGVVSHIVWDLFTHEGRWGAESLPALTAEWGPLLGYKWLQHGSSVLGLAVVAAWAVHWLSRRRARPTEPPVTPGPVRAAWLLALPLLLAVAWFGGLAVMGPFDAHFTPAHLAYRVLPPACAMWGVLTLALAVWVQRARLSRGRIETSPAGETLTESRDRGRS